MKRLRYLACLALLSLFAANDPSAYAAGLWQEPNWDVLSDRFGNLKRPAPIRSIGRDVGGNLIGTRPAGSWIELWRSGDGGQNWTRGSNVAASATVTYGDSTIYNYHGTLLSAYREENPTLGFRVRLSQSTNNGGTWSVAGTIVDWAPDSNFVGAPFLNELSDGTLQAYYDSEPLAGGGNQVIGVKTGTRDSATGDWNWGSERVVNSVPLPGGGVIRDGMPTVVNLGNDSDGNGDRLMVVTEAVKVTNGVAANVVRAFQVENGGASQNDWDNLLDSRIVYESPAFDNANPAQRYNAYAPFGVRTSDGRVVVAFSTDEYRELGPGDLDDLTADSPAAPVLQRHSEIKFVNTLSNFEQWSDPTVLWGLDHPDFVGGINSGDIFNYQIGMFELRPNELIATLDMFAGRQLVFLGVPEPSTFVLAALGMLGVLAYARRRSRCASGV